MLERALGEVLALANTEVRSGDAGTSDEGLVIYDADLPADLRERVAPAIQSIRREIASLAHGLGIEPQHRSRRRKAKAILTAEMLRLDDSYARKLRGYGEVSPQAATEIDPILDKMRTDLVDLLRLCGHDVHPNPRHKDE
ncbi:MAG: hypothetical protein ACRENK_04870 [Gemmatimonadaceae bacterium]